MPPWCYIAVYFWRTLVIWAALHIVVYAENRTVSVSFRVFVLAVAVAVLLLLLDAERRSERRFLANLGVSRAALIGVIATCFLSLEGALKLIAGGLPR